MYSTYSEYDWNIILHVQKPSAKITFNFHKKIQLLIISDK